jgi:hypothetical protein
MEDSFKSFEGVGQRMSNPLCHIDGVMILKLRAEGGGERNWGMDGLEVALWQCAFGDENSPDFGMEKRSFWPEVLWV